jgi:uncharacterized protein YheU (UPF0270 family)
MSEFSEVTIERDQQDRNAEDGVVVPLERINTETLRGMVEEFVTREWSDLTDAESTFDYKVEQVLLQFKEKRIKVVFDLISQTCNIVPNKAGEYR